MSPENPGRRRSAGSLDGFTAAHLDGDGDVDGHGHGHVELVTGGNGTLLWHRPGTRERGVIAYLRCHVGIALEDIDDDGKLEVVVSDNAPAKRLHWFKFGRTLDDPWQRFTIDDTLIGAAHDIVFGDGDGRRELVVDAVYPNSRGIFLYEPGDDVNLPWIRHTVSTGRALEGTAVADLDRDGVAEIISRPDRSKAPPAEPFSEPWRRSTFAPSHGKKCRVAVVDIAGNGRPDRVLVDSECLDGRLAWVENYAAEAGSWVEHEIEADRVYAHSLTKRESATSSKSRSRNSQRRAGHVDHP